jgi:hypothetical protein
MYDFKIIMLTIIVIHNIGNQACAIPNSIPYKSYTIYILFIS